MATPLNVFKTITYSITTSNQVVYSAPTGFTGIILMAQVANITGTDATVTFSHYDTSTTVETELVKDFTIPANDAGSLLTGKLVLETGDSVKASAGTGSALKLTLSVLESLNA
jgi:hypothetical protein